ncbi:hypothetical protein QVD17_29991 [Tagetes erecta]|uniref:Protein kinase domain-containing protein n=1 Tax=Tagetes erecta TaxID=13708 RepID=A0AAD8K2N8_TARER|nr:hypothetical protein QVD17_29991 [Tagetes erecta]
MALEKYGIAYTRISHTTSSSSQNASNLEEMPAHLRAFTERELTKAMKVTKATRIGDGSFGNVSKTVVKSLQHPKHHIKVAVRRYTSRNQVEQTYQEYATQTYQEYATQVKVLGAINHPNIVKLIGYVEDNVQMLVYEYMPNNSVFHHLYSSNTTPLSWNMRLKVAHDVARGIAYLHEASNFQVILGDFSSSNILLDENWNAKLADIRVAPHPNEVKNFLRKMHYVDPYKPPEYFMTVTTPMSNVWSYGVFLYELITGPRPKDTNRSKGEDALVEWVKPYVKTRDFISIIDPRLGAVYSMESVEKLSNIAKRCLAINPEMRPKMSEVLNMVSEIVASVSNTLEYPKKDDHPIKGNMKKWSFRALFCFK